MRKLLELRELCAGYGNGDVIHEVSLSVQKGEILALVGESGCGKTTTLKAVLGLAATNVNINKGTVCFDGRNLASLPAEERRGLLGREICTVFQNPSTSMNPIRKIKKQVIETMGSHGDMDEKEILSRCKRIFARLRLKDPDRILNSCPYELSIGMCQRICLALSLLAEPKLILADEITSALDIVNQKQIAEELQRMRREFGASIVLVSHNIAIAAQIADRIAIMEKGRIVEWDETKRILTAPQQNYTKKMLEAQSKLRAAPPAPLDKGFGDALFEVKDLSKRYVSANGDVKALDGMNATLYPEEILGIVGESGNGKSTLARQLTLLERPDSGEILFDGLSVNALRGEDRRGYYQRVQMVFQTPINSFDPKKSIRKTLENTLKNLCGLKDKKQMEAHIQTLMELVDLDPGLADRYPSQLSGGECQRAAIARAIAPRPDVLICDEATSALDVTVQAQIIELLRSLVARFHMSMILITHDIALASNICDRIMVVHDGRCVEWGTPSSLFASPKSVYTKKLVETAVALYQ